MHVERAGEHGPVVLFVHGSLAPGWGTWEAQRPLAESHRLLVGHRSGYPPNPPLDRIDFEQQGAEVAELIQPGTHLVGHSYGGVVSLLAAGRAGRRLASLTVIEPPAMGLAPDEPAVAELRAEIGTPFADLSVSPRDFLVEFVGAVGSSLAVPDLLPPQLEASVRATMAERSPAEAEIPFEAIRAGGFPVVVVSGGHSPGFDAICDVVERELRATRAVLPGANHSVPRTGAPFNAVLADFIARAEASSRPH